MDVKTILGVATVTILSSTAFFALGVTVGTKATAAVKDAIVEVSAEHVDDASERVSGWANTVERVVVKEFFARKSGYCATNCTECDE